MSTTDTPVTPRRGRDPEGRMSLRDHLRELRRRVVRSAVAVVLASIGGWFVAEPFYGALMRPIIDIQHRRGATAATLNFADPFSAFNQRLQICIIIGIIVASPVWLYQFWAFITPGLTRRERRYSIGFVAAALPLFLGGGTLAWLVLPKAFEFLNSFVPEGGSQFITASTYFSFVTRVVLAFGVAFVVPVVLVALNMAHVLSGRAMLRHWRITVFTCFLFSAIATPTPEATSMLILAGSMCLLFSIAIAICLLLDRRRARASGEPDYESLPDDEASEL